jgi:hypothetical protein
LMITSYAFVTNIPNNPEKSLITVEEIPDE